MKIHPVFHASQLSPFVVDTIPDRTPEPLPPVVTPEGEEEWEVEEVVGWRWKNKRLKTNYQYKVKWKGYPASEDSWQPVENLTNCSEMVEAFHARNPNVPRPPPLSSVSSRSRRHA